MGVNADFHASFASFNQALAEADKALADFGKGAENVGDKIERMTDKWSGARMIQDANTLVKVVNDLGGATTLTEKEQAKLNASLNEAIAKYQAIGETAPADMQKLADETKGAATSTTDWVGTLQTLASSFGIAFSVDAVVRFGEQIVAGAQALQTLSLQTGISVEALQTLKAATASYGITGDDLARALFNLQQRIAGGDQSVVVAYARMGMSLDDLRNKSPEDLFLTTERALGQLQGTAQNLAAKELWEKLGVQMIGFSKDVDTAMASVSKVPKVSSDATKALADLGDAAERSKTGFMNWVSEGVGGALLGLKNLHVALDEQGGNQLKVLAAGWMDWAETMVTGTNHAEHLATVFDELNRKQATDIQLTVLGKNAHKEAGEAVVTHADAIKFMTTLEAQATKPLLDWQAQYLDQLAKMNQLDALHASGIGVTAQQLDKYKAGLEAAKQAEADLAKAQQEADKIALDSYNKRIKSLETVTQATLKAYSFDGQIGQLQALQAAEEDLARAVYAQITSEKDRMKILEDLAAKRTAIAQQMAALEAKHAGVVNQQVIDELAAKTKILEAYGQQADGTLKIDSAQQQLQKSLDDLHAKKQEGISQYYQEQALMDQFLKDLKKETDGTDDLTEAKKKKNKATEDEITVEQKRAAAAMATFSFAGGSAVPDKFAGMSQEAMRNAGYIDLYGKVTAVGEAAGLGDSGGPIRPRAAGGPVNAGEAYLVGEQGPELFVPSQSGNISPNGAGVVVHNTFHIVDTESNIARRVADQITRSVMQGARLS